MRTDYPAGMACHGDLLRQGEGRPFHQLEAVGRNNIEHRILVENVTALADAAADELKTIFVALAHRTGTGQEMRPKPRSEERREGQEGVSTYITRGSPCHSNIQKTEYIRGR